MKTQIEFVDGPLQGTCHELSPEDVPDRFLASGSVVDGRAVIHCYQLEEYGSSFKAFFVRTEEREI